MRPELVAPAGTYEKLIWAVRYGADAVYFGTEFGSLRAYAGNFTLDEAAKGLEFLHKNDKKGYVTLNIYPFSDEYDKLLDIAGKLEDMNADALIVSDLGLIFELRKAGIKTPIHISTQASTTSSQTVLACGQIGATRVNLARELSFEQIKQICSDTARSGVEIEVFIHGAVCFSYSGRCAISDYLTGRKANRGECTHPCRWKYYLLEEQRPDKFFPVFEDDRGQYIFNCNDLALFEFVQPLARAGVASFKIEGRMKSVHYIASVVSLYRQLIDGPLRRGSDESVFSSEQSKTLPNPDKSGYRTAANKKISTEDCLRFLGRVKNRGYSAGFMKPVRNNPENGKKGIKEGNCLKKNVSNGLKGSIGPADYSYEKNLSNSGAIFVGDIIDEKTEAGCVCFVRNKIFAGEKLEVLTPASDIFEIIMPKLLKTTEGEQVEFINNPQKIVLEQKLPPYSILRRIEMK